MKKLKYEECHRFENNQLEKLCLICNEWHTATLEYFYKNKSAPDGLNPYCKNCLKKKTTEYRYEHWDHFRAWDRKRYRSDSQYQYNLDRAQEQRISGYQAEYRKANPEKFQEYNRKYSNKKHNITREEWKSCRDYFNNSCAYCGISEEQAKKEQGQRLHKEHSDCNGAGNLNNCVPACKSCNSSKHEKDMIEWYKLQQFYSDDKLDKICRWLNEDYKQYKSC